VVLCSDGVHDNFDPQIMGLGPKECGIEAGRRWSGSCRLKFESCLLFRVFQLVVLRFL
jgi:hypothetical protein